MTKRELSYKIFKYLLEDERILECTSISNDPKMIGVTTNAGNTITIRFDTADEAEKLAVKEKYVPNSLSMAVSGLFDLGIITKEEADKYTQALGLNMEDAKL